MSDTRDRMQDAGRAIESIIPPGTGFALLCFDHGKPGGRIEYVSNSRREDICRTMIEFVQKSAQSFGTHELERLLTTQLEMDEIEKDLLLYAMAECAKKHPLYDPAFTAIAERLEGMPLFLRFKREGPA